MKTENLSKGVSEVVSPNDKNEVVWVNQRYLPSDLRSTAPVPRYKYLTPSKLPEVPEDWRRPAESPIQFYSRHMEENISFQASPLTGSKEWSTLRQMLPPMGNLKKQVAPRWGTGSANPPQFIARSGPSFAYYNSPMTRYVDDMHLTNRLFKLH